jgi:ATP-dependent DNA ligase
LAAELNVESVVLDGEVIAADETGRPLFYDLVRSARRHRDFSG